MKSRAFFYIILAGILWGTSAVFVHYLAPYGFTSFHMTGIRALVSLLCMLGYAALLKKDAFRINPRYLALFFGVGACLFSVACCYYFSMQLTSVSTAVVLMYTAPIYVMIFSVLFLGEKLTRLKLTAVALMLLGCCLVAGIVGGMKFDGLGMFLGVLAGISYAGYNILAKISARMGINTVSVTLYSFAFMAIISLFWLQPTTVVSYAATDPAVTIPLLLGLGVCTFVIPYFLYTFAMKDLPAGTASALGVVEPMAATLFSVVLFGEELSLASVLGILLILAAIFMIGKAEGSENNYRM